MGLTRSIATTTWNLWRRNRRMSPLFSLPMRSTSLPVTNLHAQNHQLDVNARHHHLKALCLSRKAIMIPSLILTRIRTDQTNWGQSHHHNERIPSNTKKWWKRGTNNQWANLQSTALNFTKTNLRTLLFHSMRYAQSRIIPINEMIVD